jgi:hypothetical protein
MARYRKVSTNFWEDANVQKMSPDERFIFVFFLTNSATTESGVYEVTPITISQRLGIPLITVEDILKRKFSPNLTYDFENNIVFVHRFRRHNAGGNPKVIEKSVAKDMREFTSDKCWESFKKEYPDLFEIAVSINKGLANGCLTVGQPNNSTSTSNSNSNSKDDKNDEFLFELDIVELYSQYFPAPDYPQLLNPAETKPGRSVLGQIRARRKEMKWGEEISPWSDFFKTVQQSQFLTQKMRAFSIAWITEQTNFEKIMIGFYNDNKRSKGRGVEADELTEAERKKFEKYS